MILGQIRQETKDRAGDSSLSLTSIDLWVNLAIKQISERRDWLWNLTTKSTDTTTVDVAETSLPSDFKKMLGLRVGESAGTTEVDATDYSFVDYKSKNVSTAGNYYYLNPTNSKYGIIPTPNATGLPVYLKYWKIPVDISVSTDVPPFPENYHEAVVFFALKKYWESADDFSKSLYYNAEFENMVERMEKDNLRSTGHLTRVKDVRELVGIEHPQRLNSVELGR